MELGIFETQTKFIQKGYFQSKTVKKGTSSLKTEKVNIPIKFSILKLD